MELPRRILTLRHVKAVEHRNFHIPIKETHFFVRNSSKILSISSIATLFKYWQSLLGPWHCWFVQKIPTTVQSFKQKQAKVRQKVKFKISTSHQNWGLFVSNKNCFYRAMLCTRDTCHGLVSVCLSLCLSQVGVLLKWLNVGSHKQHHTIAQGVAL